jgi:hypothetical protein
MGSYGSPNITPEARFRAGGPHFHAGDPTGTVAWLI